MVVTTFSSEERSEAEVCMAALSEMGLPRGYTVSLDESVNLDGSIILSLTLNGRGKSKAVSPQFQPVARAFAYGWDAACSHWK